MKNLDEVDSGILSSLQVDARRTTNTEIAEAVDVSPATVGDRIDRLRSAGVIRTTHADIDYEEAGFPHYLLATCSVPTSERDAAAERTLRVDGVVAVRELLTGEANLHVELVGPSCEALAATVESIEEAGVDVRRVEIVEAERRRPFNGLDRFVDD